MKEKKDMLVTVKSSCICWNILFLRETMQWALYIYCTSYIYLMLAQSKEAECLHESSVDMVGE